MKTLYIVMAFLTTLGIAIGIYTASYNQFNLNGASLTYSTTNQVVVSGGNQFQNSTFITTTISTIINGTTTTTTTTILNPSSTCVSVIPFACSLQLSLLNGLAFLECQLGNTVDCQPNAGQIAQGVGNSLLPSSPGIPGVPPLLSTSALSSTNSWFALFNNPLDSAISIMGIFLGLGILAGLLGAGILAVRIASVGIGLSVITFIETSLKVFGGMPGLVYIGFNGVMGILLLVVAWEAFNAPGGGAG